MVISVPSPSTVIEPPSSTRSVPSRRSSPSASSTRVAKTASSSQGTNFPPQALKPNWIPARFPSPSATKIGPESRAQESSSGISTTSTPAPHCRRASSANRGSAAISTGSNAAIAFATSA